MARSIRSSLQRANVSGSAGSGISGCASGAAVEANYEGNFRRPAATRFSSSSA